MIEIGLTDYKEGDLILDIRDKNQVIKARYGVNAKDIEKYTLMKEHYIELSFFLNKYMPLKRADYIDWNGMKFMLKKDYRPNEINKKKFEYKPKFEALWMILTDIQYYYLNQNLKESEWRLTGNPEYFLKIGIDNINRYFGTEQFKLGVIELDDMKDISFDINTNTFDAFNQVAEKYEAEWYFTGYTLNFVKKVSFGAEIEFETDVSIQSISRSEGENSKVYYNRILALGSTRNIPRNYREPASGEAVDSIYQKRLRIPIDKGDVIDAFPNMSPEEAVEGTVIFDKVYPKRIGTIEAVETIDYKDTNTETGEVTNWKAYKIKDSGLNFKEEYMLPGQELRIVFESGNMKWMDFALEFYKDGFSKTDDSQYFEIFRNEDYGKPLPNETLRPQVGDTYAIYGFDIQLVSDAFVPAAEKELFETASAWLQDLQKDKGVYDCKTMIQYFADNEMNLEIGQKVKLVGEQFDNGSRSSRIMGYEKKLINKYDATYKVGDNAVVSRLGSMESKIEELEYAGKIYQSSGGNGVYLIKQFDTTRPSDFNAYSSKASDAKYFNKQTGGTVQGATAFQQGVSISGKTMTDDIQSLSHSAGQLGHGFRLWIENGLSYGQLDYLTVTREFLINTLTIAETKSVGGQIILSLANIVCESVVDGGTYWQCKFNNDNGSIPNNFAVNDQAICRKFNGTAAKYYWARVTSVGDNYINISKTDKDGSGVPAIGDEIIQFGNRTNTARQSAILLSAYGSDAPSIKQYAGINSYDLTGREATVISPKGNKFKGDFTIQSSGKSVATAINDAKTEAINTASTDATNKVNSISIGGRNLLNNTLNRVTIVGEDKANQSVPLGFFTPYAKKIEHQNVCISFDYDFTGISGEIRLFISDGYQQLYTFDFSKIPYKGRLKLENVVIWSTAWGSTLNFLYLRLDNVPLSFTGYAERVKFEIGNKCTDYSESPEDVDRRTTTALTTANNAIQLLSDIANDNLLTPSEKQTTLKEWNIIQGEYNTLVSQADEYGISSANYKTKYNDLNSYVSPLLSNMTTNSSIVGDTFRARFKDYYDAKIALLKAITDKAKQLADEAQTAANNANSELVNKVAYSEYNSQMQVLNNKIASKVSQTDFNTLGNRVSQTESSITQQAGQITSVVEKVANLNIEGRNLIIRHNERANSIIGESGSVDVYYGSSLMDGFISITEKESLSFSKYGSNAPNDSYFRFAYFKEDGVTVVLRKAIYVDKFKEIAPEGAAKLWVSYPTNCQVKIERGEKVTSWSEAPEDTNAKIQQADSKAQQAQTNAQNAQNTANKAQTDATSANNLLADIANNNKLTPNEKQITKKEWDSIVSEYSKNTAQATKFGVSYTTYQTAYNALNSYITPLLSNLGTTSDINGATFRATFKAYYDARTDLLNAISVKAKELADAAQTSANTAQNTANSKNRTYYQDDTPVIPSGGHKVGDLWHMESLVDIDGNINADTAKNIYQLQRRWNGSEWTRINWSASRAKITQTDSNINLLTEKTGIDSLGVGETLKSLIDLVPDQIKLEVSKVQVGGVNLLPNSSFLNGVSPWTGGGGYAISVDATNKYGNYNSLKCIANVSGEPMGYIDRFLTMRPQANGDHLFSFYAKSDIPRTLRIRIDDVVESFTITTEWQRFERSKPHRDHNIIMWLTSAGTIWMACPQLEAGNKVTSWSLAPEDVEAGIDKAQSAADAAQTNATNANNLLLDISNDNKLTPNEKQNTKKEWDAIQSEYSKNITQAINFSVPYTVYTNAYNSLNSYITPLLSNLGVTSDINGATFRSTFKTYLDARTDLMNAIAAKAKSIADSKTTLDEVKSGMKVEADGVTIFGKKLTINALLIAQAIEAASLSIGGNMTIQKDGTITIADGKIILNADGSGQLASGNITWDAKGNPTVTGKFESNKGDTRITIDPESKEFNFFLNGKLAGRIFILTDVTGTGSKVVFETKNIDANGHEYKAQLDNYGLVGYYNGVQMVRYGYTNSSNYPYYLVGRLKQLGNKVGIAPNEWYIDKSGFVKINTTGGMLT